MEPTQHATNNAVLGAPANWDQQTLSCSALPITRTTIDGYSALISFWRPTPDELQQLQAGGLVTLCVHGPIHPVVSLGVTP